MVCLLCGSPAAVPVVQVLHQVACRGENERDFVIRDGLADLVVNVLPAKAATGAATAAASSTTPVVGATALQLLQALAFDARNRPLLRDAIAHCLGTMQRLPRDMAVQVAGCKFLQFMAYDEDCKQQITQHQGIFTVLDATSRFPNDPQLAISASDLVYFLSLDLDGDENEKRFHSTVEDIVDNITMLMRVHPSVEQVQTHGIATLNR